MSLRPHRTLLDRMHRLAKFRLLVPLKRSQHPPEYTARGAAIGLAVALTPTVGIQLVTVFALWGLLRWFPRADFNLVVALAWVWVTNVLTMLPIYYVFYVTGQIMLMRWDDLSGYQGFVELFNTAINLDQGMVDMVWALIKLAAKEQGLPLFVGSLPWAVGLAWLGYVWSMKFLRTRQAARLRRFKETAKPREDVTPPN